MRIFSIAMTAIFLAGCASTTPASSDVRLTSNSAEVEGCQSLGEVRGDHNLFGGALIRAAIDDAENKLRTQAGSLGGNVVYLTRQSTGWAGANFAGTAYRC